MPLIRIHTPDALAGFTAHPAITLATATELTRHTPDSHWLVADDAGQVLARCSLWWTQTAAHAGHRLGYIGHWAAADDPSAADLLAHACAELTRHQCTLAVGPLDGTTWRRYRFIVERGSQPPFFLEPDNPDAWPRQFTAAGFTTFAGYLSSLNTEPGKSDPRAAEIARRMADQGVTIRGIDPAHLERELDGIFRLSLSSFRNNLLYSPIEREEFMAMYGGIQPYLRRELTLVAEQNGQTVGFFFALPDMLQAQRGREIDQVILKTIAIKPDRALSGLGRLLFAKVLANARELGYTRAVHALMHEANRSVNLGRGDAVAIRRYALFARKLP
jgi:GNAT superfamily N-acetyltransferase